MKKTTRRFLYVLALVLLISTASGYAQFNGNVQGTVQDSKGAVVPGATVTLINADTGVTQTAVSNSSGVYRFVSLAPGNYTVSTAEQGFSPASVSFNLATDQTRDVPLVLAVEKVSSTITVTTAAPLIDTSDSRFEQTLVPADAVKVKVEKGWITLTGEVDWRYQQEAALNDVRELWGVIGVTNDMTIRHKPNAADIRDKILLALDRSWFDPASIAVTAESGKVKLTGKVHSWSERDEAGSAAWAAPGTTRVENDLLVS
jgi:osmotically-inducible protein OsmY